MNIPTLGGPLRPLLLVIAMVTASCASTPRPTVTLALASESVTHAANAGGNEAAPVEMNQARDKLNRATVAADASHHEEAQMLALEAQVDAQLAEAKAQSRQARKAADTVNADSRALREELDRKAK
jgi:hypothetical protein